jgi:tyrosine-protein kinase Etk/Wzc
VTRAGEIRLDDERRETGALPFLVRLLRWRRRVLLNTLIVAVLAVVISLLLPNWYEARTSVLPPQEETLSLGSLTRGIGSALAIAGRGALNVPGGSLPMWATPSDLLATILRSRRLRETVIRENDLERVFKTKNLDQALETFAARCRVRVGAEGVVRLAYLDKDAKRAAAVANGCTRVLDEIQRETRHGSASEVRRFVGARLDSTRVAMAAAEVALRDFQQRHGLLVPEDQAKALVEAVAKIDAERLAALVERDALRAEVGPEHPEVLRADALARSLAEAQASLEGRGGPLEGPADRRTALIDLGRLPDLSLEFLRLYREVETRTTLYALLLQMYEQYRIEEVRDTPTIQVLDPAAPPEEKARPHRAVICVVATLLAFAASVGIAAGLEKIALLAERDPPRYATLQRLLRGLGLGILARR